MSRFPCRSLLAAFVAAALLPSNLHSQDAGVHEGNWLSWRGPLQTGVSLERYEDYEFNEEPIWTDEIRGRGTPVVFDGRIYSWGYRGDGPDLEEVVQARDEETGDVIWEQASHDFISDTVYNRYAIGSVAVDAETGNVYLHTSYGLFTCFSPEGEILWQLSMQERFGRLTFPNGRAGAPVIDGDLVITRAVTSYWGADGPARDRFFGFNKHTGGLMWSSTPGLGGDWLKDTSFSTPFFETVGNRRVFYAGTGCGNLVCINVGDGQPLWRYHVTVGGLNASPVRYGDTLIAVHGTENLDTTEMGRGFAVRLPEDFDNPGGEVDPEQGGAPALPGDHEAWRNNLEMFTSSPTLVGDRVFQTVKTGRLHCFDAATGEEHWNLKLANEQLHSSPVYADGKLYVAFVSGEFFVIDVSGNEPEVLHELHLDGEAIGSPAICNGRVYVHTTEKLYAFEIKHSAISWDPAPETEMPEPGEPAKLIAKPADVLLTPGSSLEVELFKADRYGNIVGEAGVAEWETFIPPAARVRSTMDASFEGNTIAASPDASVSAGAWKASLDGLEGVVRGRVVPSVPFSENFETGFELNEEGYAFPPLAWIGARLKFQVEELEGTKVLAKTLDRVLFQRSLSFIGDPDASGYTVQTDMMTDGSRRVKSSGGVIVHRYIVALVGNSNTLEVTSNYERVWESVPFPIAVNEWYTIKARVDLNEDGSGVVRAKAWKREDPEPDEWTIEVPHARAHAKGAPGVYGFAPQVQHKVYLDNISVYPNE